MAAVTRVRARWAAAATVLVVAAAGCGSTTFTTNATALPTGTPSVAPTASAAASSGAASAAPEKVAATISVTPTYGTDGSLVTATITGAPANYSVNVALCSLKTPTAKAATVISSCDPVILTVTTNASGGALADYTIAEVPAASTHGYAIVLRGAGGAILAATGFNPDMPATPTPRPTATPRR